MKHFRFVGLAVVVACSGDGNGQIDASIEGGGLKDSGKDSTTADSGSDAQSSDAGADGDDGGTSDASDGGEGGSTGDGSAQCTVPATPPSGGSCIALNDASVQCNPVTNAPCDVDAGLGCDTDFDGGYLCLPQSSVSLCGDCNEVHGPWCIGTATCLPLSDAGTERCFRYCCTDSDCTPGTCNKTFGISPLGACTQ